MNKLIKAEFYRSMRSGIFLPIYALMSLFTIYTTFLMYRDSSVVDGDGYELVAFLASYSEGGVIVLGEVISIIISLMIGKLYSDRFHYYEIMDGANTHHIILSKLIVYNIYSLVIVVVPVAVSYTAIAVNYGTGGIEKPWLPILILAIIIMNATSLVLLISMIIRRAIIGTVISYCYSMIIIMLYLFYDAEITGVRNKIAGFLFDTSPCIQITKLGYDYTSAKYIAMVAGSFVVTVSLLYTLTYISHRRKNFR